MSDKSNKILNDYLSTLLDMSEPAKADTQRAEGQYNAAQNEIEPPPDNLINFPETAIVKDSVSGKDKAIEKSNKQELQPQFQVEKKLTEPKLSFKEKDIIKVDLTSHTRLNLAQKLLQEYEVRVEQQLKTEKEQQTQLKIKHLVKQAADCQLSVEQLQKLLTLLKAKNLTQEIAIVEASIKVMQEQAEETDALVAAEHEVTSAPPEKLKSDASLAESFQCLIFHVGTLKVAVPLSKLGGIHEIDDSMTSIPGKPPWYLGIIDYAGENYHVVDSAYWISPEHQSKMDSKYDFFIVMGDSKWGIGCTKIGDAITINKSDIRWASKNSKKSWFAGMLVDEMCALLDIDNFIEELLTEQ